MATVTRRPYPRSILSMVNDMERVKPAAPKAGKKKAEPVKAAGKKAKKK